MPIYRNNFVRYVVDPNQPHLQHFHPSYLSLSPLLSQVTSFLALTDRHQSRPDTLQERRIHPKIETSNSKKVQTIFVCWKVYLFCYFGNIEWWGTKFLLFRPLSTILDVAGAGLAVYCIWRFLWCVSQDIFLQPRRGVAAYWGFCIYRRYRRFCILLHTRPGQRCHFWYRAFGSVAMMIDYWWWSQYHHNIMVNSIL